jgi:hypothetical protein
VREEIRDGQRKVSSPTNDLVECTFARFPISAECVETGAGSQQELYWLLLIAAVKEGRPAVLVLGVDVGA